MKKMMIVAAFAIAAAVSQAANVNWKCADGIANGTESGMTAATTVYLINASTLTANDIYTAVQGGQTLADAVAGNYVKSVSLDEGTFSTLNFDVASTGAQTMYMVCYDAAVSGGSLYFSDQATKTLSDVGTQTYSFSAGSSVDPAATSMTGFSAKNGGWVAVTPEPTSGLLLLIGMAGLALRRRRA